MVEAKGSVKLFGVTIKVATQRWDLPKGGDRKKFQGPLIDKALNETKAEEQQADSGENSEPAASSVETEHNEMTLVDEEHTAGNSSKSEEKQEGKSNIQEKPLQKPTEILPCPRCHSLETKFCYFNNYNVSQPRHFCKACQRYWTDGGTMRNMAVGAGRRKSKSSISQYKHTALFSATLQSIPSDILITFNHPEQEADGAAPTLRSGAFPFITNEQFLNLNNKTAEVNCNKKECEGVKGFLVFRPNISDRVHNSSGPFRTYSSSAWEKDHEEPVLRGFQAYKHHAPSPNMVPFSSQWNPGHAFSTPYMPASFHLMNSDQKKSGMSGSLELTALEPMACITTSTSSSTTPSGSGPTSTFNKHLTDGSILRKKRGMPCDYSEEISQENSLRMPTRIEDPNEAAKSSTWTTMRNKGNASDGFFFRGLSNTSQSKVQNIDEKKEISDALHANPSAWLRSLEFHENIQWRKDRVNVSRQG